MTGEPLPVDAARGATVRSGTVNAGPPFELRATRGARESSYAALVELVRAASVDQLSAHVLAEGPVHGAIAPGLTLEQPAGAHEAPGDGIEAMVDGRRVGVGGESWLLAQGFAGDGGSAPEALDAAPGQALVRVGVDARATGMLVMGDRLRPDAADLVAGCTRRACATWRGSRVTAARSRWPSSPTAGPWSWSATASTMRRRSRWRTSASRWRATAGLSPAS